MSLFKDSGYLFTSNVLILATSLATGVVTARLLGPQGKGELYLIMQIVTLGSLLFSCGLGASYQYHLAKGVYQKHQIVSHMLLQTGAILFLLLATYLSRNHLPAFLSKWILSDDLFALTCIMIGANVAILFIHPIFMTFPEGIRVISCLGALSSLTNLVLLVLLLAVFKLGVVGAAIGYLISLLIKLVPPFRQIMAGVWRNLTLSWRGSSRNLFSFGIGSFICNFTLSSAFRIDVFILSMLLDISAVGVYSVAVAFAEVALMAPNALGISLFAHLPSADPKQQIEIVGRSSRIILATALVTGVVLICISYPLVRFSMGRAFVGAVLPLCLLVPGLVAMSVNYVFANFYSAQGKPMISAVCFGCGVSFNIVANLILVPIAGISGAAIASTASYAFISALFILLLRRQHQLSLGSLLILNSEDRSLLKSRMLSMVGGLLKKPLSDSV